MQNLGNGPFVMSRTDAQNVLDMVFKDMGREGEGGVKVWRMCQLALNATTR